MTAATSVLSTFIEAGVWICLVSVGLVLILSYVTFVSGVFTAGRRAWMYGDRYISVIILLLFFVLVGIGMMLLGSLAHRAADGRLYISTNCLSAFRRSSSSSSMPQASSDQYASSASLADACVE